MNSKKWVTASSRIFNFLLIDFSKKIFENLFHKWGTTWEYIKLTTRSRKSKTYYLGIYGLLPTCSFYSDLTVAFWLISSEFIIKCAQQTGHFTVLSYKRNFGPPYSLILYIHDDHISVEGVIKRAVHHSNLLRISHLIPGWTQQ